MNISQREQTYQRMIRGGFMGTRRDAFGKWPPHKFKCDEDRMLAMMSSRAKIAYWKFPRAEQLQFVNRFKETGEVFKVE